MKSLRPARITCILVTFCFATAIAGLGQTFTYGQFHGVDGGNPTTAPVQGLNGNLYGTTGSGGTNGWGTIYELTPDGKYSKIYNFCSQAHCTDGQSPQGLIVAANGNFYGLTAGGGANNCSCGTFFELTPAGRLITLYSFCSLTNCADGSVPLGSLVQGINGNFYGTTITGGVHCSTCGTVFEITPAGRLTTLHSFCNPQVCKDGFQPQAGLILANDGNFYGTTSEGGANGNGTVFKMSPSGVGSILHSFCSEPNCADGWSPEAALIQGTNGNLYGTASGGGAYDEGVAFQLTLGGVFTTLHAFCPNTCADGQTPTSPLIQANDGNFYSTTYAGGLNGNIFEMTSDGIVTTLYDFCVAGPPCIDGYSPYSGLTQHTNGTFYGSADYGAYTDRRLCHGPGCGTLFSLSTGLGPLVIANPGFAKIGQRINVLGNNLTGATIVTFNGTPATEFTVTDTYIKATVPSGATTGLVQITTPGGMLTTDVAFQVLP